MHKEENVYVPELIFGHLLTSSNYDDDEKKVSPPLSALQPNCTAECGHVVKPVCTDTQNPK